MPHKHGQLHDGSTVLERVKQTTFFVTHIATSLIMEVHQLATSINLSCHITSTPRLVLLQPSNLSRIFTTTHTLLKQSSIRNNPMTQLHTSDSQASLTTSLFLSLCWQYYLATTQNEHTAHHTARWQLAAFTRAEHYHTWRIYTTVSRSLGDFVLQSVRLLFVSGSHDLQCVGLSYTWPLLLSLSVYLFVYYPSAS